MTSMTWPRAIRLPRFITLGGAVVEIVRHTYRSATDQNHSGHAWRCLGCDAQGADAEWIDHVRFPADIRIVRARANGHAGGCRSIPKGTAVNRGA